jgi:hypothetical protein
LTGNGFEDLGGAEWRPPVNKYAVMYREASARADQLEKIGAAILYHDERGQGIGYKEAMDALAALLAARGGK